MSELKAYSGEDILDRIDIGDKIDLDYINKQFVEKSEADKVIAELKAQVNGLHNRANLWHYNAQNEHNAAVEEHMKNAKLKYKLAEKDKQIEELEESHKKEVGQLLMKIAELEKLVETADKLLKQRGGFTVKEITFNGVKLEGFKKEGV